MNLASAAAPDGMPAPDDYNRMKINEKQLLKILTSQNGDTTGRAEMLTQLMRQIQGKA